LQGDGKGKRCHAQQIEESAEGPSTGNPNLNPNVNLNNF
jgi:hypothetical protein